MSGEILRQWKRYRIRKLPSGKLVVDVFAGYTERERWNVAYKLPPYVRSALKELKP